MGQLSVLLSLFDSPDPAVEAQGWELCASLPLWERITVARALSARYRWGQAARGLLPDDDAGRDALLERFTVDCVAEGLPLLQKASPLFRFCTDALTDISGLSAPERALWVRQGQWALRRASVYGPPPLVPRLIFDATVVVLSPRGRDHAARHASALVCRAHNEHGAGGERVRVWQKRRFFSLFLPAAEAGERGYSGGHSSNLP